MDKTFVIYYFLFSFILNTQFDPDHYQYNTDYTPLPIEHYTKKGKYYSDDPCVTVYDLIAFHYTETNSEMDTISYVSPENFCYGHLEYNITRNDYTKMYT